MPAHWQVCTTSSLSVVEDPVRSDDVNRVTLVKASSEPRPVKREEGVWWSLLEEGGKMGSGGGVGVLRVPSVAGISREEHLGI